MASKRELQRSQIEANDLRQKLKSAEAQIRQLEDELQSSQEAQEHMQRELAWLWRVMSSRKRRNSGIFAAMLDSDAFDLNTHDGLTGGGQRPGGDVRVGIGSPSERLRIQEQISRVRSLSRQRGRRWPWAQTG